jgi:hypothetical protein
MPGRSGNGEIGKLVMENLTYRIPDFSLPNYPIPKSFAALLCFPRHGNGDDAVDYTSTIGVVAHDDAGIVDASPQK